MSIRMNQDDETRAKTGRQPRLPPYGQNSNIKRRREEKADYLRFIENVECKSSAPYLSQIQSKTVDEVYQSRDQPAIIEDTFLQFNQEQTTFLEQFTKLEQLDDPESPFTVGEQKQNCPELPGDVRVDVLGHNPIVCTWEKRNEISEIRCGYGMIVDRRSFRAFHYDLEEDYDCLLTLSHGKKLWIVAPPGYSSGSILERFAGDNESHRGFTDFVRCLEGLSRTVAKRMFWGWLEPGKTLYLPATSMHAVLSVQTDRHPISMFSFELQTDEERRMKNRRKALSHCKASMRTSKALALN